MQRFKYLGEARCVASACHSGTQEGEARKPNVRPCWATARPYLNKTKTNQPYKQIYNFI